MRTQMTMLVALASGLLSLTLAGRAASQKSGKLAPALVPGSDPCPSCAHPGLFGITRGQSMRINAANLQAPGDPDQPPPEPEGVELSFFDTQGNLIARSEQSLPRGRAVFFDLSGDHLPIRETERAEILAEVRLTPPEPDQAPPDPDRSSPKVVFSVEVFDNSGIDAGKTRMGWNNHNEALVSDPTRAAH